MIPLNQKIQTISSTVDVTERRSKLLNDRSEYYTIEELKSAVATTDESKLFSALLEPTVASGAYTFDIDSARRFVIGITEGTVLTVPTLSVSTAVVFTADVTGDFALTIADSTVTPTSDTYDGTVSNRLTFDCYRPAVGSQVNIVTIENIG